MRLPGNESGDDDEHARLTITPADPDLGSGTGGAPEPIPDLTWLSITPSPDHEPGSSAVPRHRMPRRMPLRGWAALAALAVVTVGVVTGVHDPHHSATGGGAGAVTATRAVSAGAGVCAGLSGAVVTERSGDPATMPGVIATFEDAYYTRRNAEAAMRVIAPESGITQQALAAGIATIPAGTRHCVAITPVTVNTANVHLVEVHPDHKRVDYLQVINTISGPRGGLLISHVQEQS